MWADCQYGDHGLTRPLLIGSVLPEDPPRPGGVVLYVGVPDLHVPVDWEALVQVRVQARVARVLLQAHERPPYFLQLGQLIRAAVRKRLESLSSTLREAQRVR